MSETDHRTEPHVSTEELRAALAPRGETRRNPVLVSEHPSTPRGRSRELRDALEPRARTRRLRTELDVSRRAIDSARADAIELRAALDAARGDAAELRAELAAVRSRACASAAPRWRELASAGLFRRRKVSQRPRRRAALGQPLLASAGADPASRRRRRGRCRSWRGRDAR